MSPSTRRPSPVPCIAFSIASGCVAALSVNTAAYPVHLENSGKRLTPFTDVQRFAFAFVSLLLAVVQLGTFLVALDNGPMSLTIWVSCAVGLMTNMLLQMSLQIKRYTKSMRTGILVLSCAVTVLVETGPVRRDGQKLSDCFFTVEAFVCSLLQFLCIGFGMAWLSRSRAAPATCLRKTGSYALVSASATVLAVSSAKAALESLAHEEHGWTLLSILIGAPAALLTLTVDAAAMIAVDVSVYVPTTRCLQLLQASFVGLCIWQDHLAIDAWTAYAMVHALLLLGVYQVSTFDVVRGLRTWWSIWGLGAHETPNGSGSSRLGFGSAVKQLREVWTNNPTDEAASASALEEMLESGLQQGILEPIALLELAMILARRHHETGPAGVVMDWALENALLIERDSEAELMVATESLSCFDREAIPATSALASCEIPLLTA